MSKAGQRLIRAARSFIPAEADVRAIRLKLDLDQLDFALQFGFSVNQIRDWEQRRTRPSGAMRAYLAIIDRDPETVRNLLATAMKKAA